MFDDGSGADVIRGHDFQLVARTVIVADQ
jgi:hypothetical protein